MERLTTSLVLALVLVNFQLSVGFSPLASQNNTNASAPHEENKTSIAEQSGKSFGFMFSPIWLKDASNQEEDTVDQKQDEKEEYKDDEDNDKEVTVHENEYINNNTRVSQEEELHMAETMDEESAISLTQEHPEDDDDDDDVTEEDEEELENEDVLIHESVPEEHRDMPMAEEAESLAQKDSADVQVREWNEKAPPLIEENDLESDNDVIDSANSVSAPWYDLMSIGLLPSVAYNWQFLMDLSAKLRTAPRDSTTTTNTEGSANRDDYNTRLKYLLTRVQNVQAAQPLPTKLDNLKQKHLLKAKLNSHANPEDHDILTWAWRRAAHLQ